MYVSDFRGEIPPATLGSSVKEYTVSVLCTPDELILLNSGIVFSILPQYSTPVFYPRVIQNICTVEYCYRSGSSLRRPFGDSEANIT